VLGEEGAVGISGVSSDRALPVFVFGELREARASLSG
jgi:hypothetical protein